MHLGGQTGEVDVAVCASLVDNARALGGPRPVW